MAIFLMVLASCCEASKEGEKVGSCGLDPLWVGFKGRRKLYTFCGVQPKTDSNVEEEEVLSFLEKGTSWALGFCTQALLS